MTKVYFSFVCYFFPQRLPDILSKELASVDQQNVKELTTYIVDSFGNPTRIDYGTGHELSFCMFLCGLFKVYVLKQSDSKATVNVLFLRLVMFIKNNNLFR